MRVDPLTGATVVVVGARQGRPNLPDGCPFCPGGLEAPDDYDVRWFENRWPPLPDGRAEVLLYSPRHDATLGGLGIEGVRGVVDLWADRTTALGARDDVAYVLPFENRGPEVGATIQHPHGQLYAFADVPVVARQELGGGTCRLCGIDHGDRLVRAADGWWTAVPYGPTWPYEVVIAPDAHVPDVPAATPGQRTALAAALVDALTRLDQLFGEPMPYMLWVHQRPTDGGPWPTAHVHLHVAPLLRGPGTIRYVAAAEQASGVLFDPVVPEAAAAELRALPGPPA